MFLARENKTLLFWLSLPGKNPVMKIDHLYIFIFFPLFFFGFSYIYWTLATKAEYVVKFDLQKKRYQQIIKTAQLYLFILFILVQIKVIIKSDTFYKTHNTQLLSFKFKCPEINTLLQRHACLIQHLCYLLFFLSCWSGQ